MTKALSMDLRERAMARLGRGETIRSIGKGLGVSASSVSKWSKRLKETGSVAAAKTGGHRPAVLNGDHAVWLRARINEADFTLRALVSELGEHGCKTSYYPVWKFVHGEDLSFKKKRFTK
jgi:putative transposase